jgi:general stress protein YciG
MADEPKQRTNRQNRVHKRGFASMDGAKRSEIARQGGKAAHARGTAHEFNSEEARAAGRKGGKARAAANK